MRSTCSAVTDPLRELTQGSEPPGLLPRAKKEAQILQQQVLGRQLSLQRRNREKDSLCFTTGILRGADCNCNLLRALLSLLVPVHANPEGGLNLGR